MRVRQVNTCDRCRRMKRRCDLLKPVCSRCLHSGAKCSFDASSSDENIPSTVDPLTSSNTSTPPEENVPKTTVSDDSGPRGSDHINLQPDPSTQFHIKRRRRARLSCHRCHRIKVKCDKQSPCSRCVATGHHRDCSYSNNDKHKRHDFPDLVVIPSRITATGKDEKHPRPTWVSAHRGSSHWKELMTRILSLPHLKDLPFPVVGEETAKNGNINDIDLPYNFPFGSPGASKYSSRDAVIMLVNRAKSVYKAYVHHGLEVFDPLHPLLTRKDFEIEIEQYWSRPSDATFCWLAEFLMVLGLGCSACPTSSHPATEFYMAAEACLMQTPFMFQPNLSILKALSLMVLAKYVHNTSCCSIESCYALLGLLVRLAIMCGLDQETVQVDREGEGTERWESQRNLWTFIQYLDIKASLTTGMPPHVQYNATSPPRDWIPCWHDDGPSNLQQPPVYDSFPLIYMILARVNSPTNKLSYPEVLEYNAKIRRHMKRSDKASGNPLLRTTLDIYFRRALLALHRNFALEINAPSAFPESYWSSLECSLAVLMHYRELSIAHDDPGTLNVTLGLFMPDLFVAALTVCIHLLQRDAPLAEPAIQEPQPPPRQTIVETLQSCREIWSREKNKSICHQKGSAFLDAIVNFVSNISSTPEQPCHSNLLLLLRHQS